MSKQDKDQELLLHGMSIEDGAVNMKLGGEPANLFMGMLVGFFEENGGENFLTTTIQSPLKRYEITIRNLDGIDSPAEKLGRIEEEKHELHAVLSRLQAYLDFSKPVESSIEFEDITGINQAFKDANDLLLKLNYHQ